MIVDQVTRMLAGETGLMLPRERTGAVVEFSPTAFDPAGTSRSAPALVLFTSGSTGAPKGVGLGLDALLASARATEQLLGGAGMWHLCLPANHIAGLQVVFRSLLAGHAPSVAAPGPFTARTFAAELSASLRSAGSAPVFTSLVPTQLVRVLEDAEAVAAAAACAAVLLGGAAISPRLLERADAAGIPVVRTYGMSETAGGCVYDGVPFPEVRLGFDSESRVVLSGPVLADGYVSVAAPGGAAPLLTAVPNQSLTASGSAASSTGPGFWGEGSERVLVTSDLGRWSDPGPDGVLEVLGRTDDIIVTGGENVSPHEVEAHLLHVAEPLGFSEVLVSSTPDEEWGQVLVALLVPAAGQADAEAEAEAEADADAEARTETAAVAADIAAQPAPEAPSGAGRSAPGPASAGSEPCDGTPTAPALLGSDLLRRLQEGLRNRGLASAALPRVAYRVSAIPARGIGKPDRRRTRALTVRLASHPRHPGTFAETPAEQSDDSTGRDQR